MANLTPVASLSAWFLREQPISSKFNSELKDKVNTLISNHVLINDDLEELFQGAASGAQQAKIPFGLASAPLGWSRDTSIGNDNTLRVTDGSTTPPGTSPTFVGGAEGGSWSIIGLTSSSTGAHTHTLAAHTHNLSDHTHGLITHTHGSTGHTHNIGAHQGLHTIPSFTQVLSSDPPGPGLRPGQQSAGSNVSVAPHTHTPSSHSHTINDTVGGVSTTGLGTGNPTSFPNSAGSGGAVTNGPSTDTSSSAGSHNHGISNDGTWRPQYLNILLCKRD